ncbi:MAG: tRNA guanosine(34) transglycosylase Tgt [Candidatus Moranbacteria bacterium]|nr:tRNA guanosine(34) transglycosylase Tgt [Candidatus Moranbacteria bacterium]
MEINGKKAETPLFMPIATRGAVKSLAMSEVEQIGYEIVLGNTYHLWLKPGDKTVKKAGGIAEFSGWNNLVLTDSGGFQVFSLGERAKQRFGKKGVRLTEKGVYFSEPGSGERHFMSPEKSVDIQINLGADIIMCLDECPPYPCDYQKAKESLELTARWAKRCKDYFERKHKGKKDRPLLFGIIQGSVFEDLRKESAKQLVELGFDGYAIGGVAVGEPRELLKEILDWTMPILPENKPRYLMGLGKPEEIVRSVSKGVDMFDCVIPTREGRHGRIFLWRKNGFSRLEKGEADFYKTINISNEKFREDFRPIDKHCDCSVCRSYTRAYLRHLFSTGETLAARLASLHNLNFYYQLIKRLRNEIKESEK